MFITGADIDTLCVFPKHVEREHFFTIMYDMLKARPEVTELSVMYFCCCCIIRINTYNLLQAVPDAYVPVIKMHFSGIPVSIIIKHQ